jgi:hypothetical protein
MKPPEELPKHVCLTHEALVLRILRMAEQDDKLYAACATPEDGEAAPPPNPYANHHFKQGRYTFQIGGMVEDLLTGEIVLHEASTRRAINSNSDQHTVYTNFLNSMQNLGVLQNEDPNNPRLFFQDGNLYLRLGNEDLSALYRKKEEFAKTRNYREGLDAAQGR